MSDTLCKTCENRMMYKQCSRRHPHILHVDTETNAYDTTALWLKSPLEFRNGQEMVGYTGAGEAVSVI